MTQTSLSPAAGYRPATATYGRPRSSAGHLLGVAIVCLVAFGMTCYVFVWLPAGQQADQSLLTAAKSYAQDSALLTTAEAMLRFFGNPLVLAVMLGGVLLLGLLSRRPLAGVAGVGVFVGSVALATILKTVISRPDLDVAGSTTHNSFPSGHVSAAAGLLFAFLLAAPLWLRWLLVLPGLGAVGAVAAATMLAGWHRFSDAVGGVLLAGALCCLAAAVLAGVSQAGTARHRSVLR
ncbi:phosphatase PAP2 family protein [Fodinicola acaciae]|uniref:phosphatase PAP2 family protein n=1 Tax=Fodinicola acaciae TaxID=2681555 RepID=UPI0013D8CA6E|nr:phosphatase PAP2 family protein [Fodinicola acaciae]